MSKDPIRYLSLARKAGRLAVGTEECEQLIGAGRRGLLVLAADAGVHAEKRAAALAENRALRLMRVVYSKSELAAAVGRGSSVALALITDEGLAAAFAAAAANGKEQEEQI